MNHCLRIISKAGPGAADGPAIEQPFPFTPTDSKTLHFNPMNHTQTTHVGSDGSILGMGVPDAELLKPFMAPFTPAEMQRLPIFHAFVQVLMDEGPTEPVVMRSQRPRKRKTKSVTIKCPSVTRS